MCHTSMYLTLHPKGLPSITPHRTLCDRDYCLHSVDGASSDLICEVSLPEHLMAAPIRGELPLLYGRCGRHLNPP